MSKNIPNPIIKIGYSTKKNGAISSDIDGNKISKMSDYQFQELKNEIISIRKKLNVIRGKAVGLLTPNQYDEIESLVKNGNKLKAVKTYKEYTGVRLLDAKNFVDQMLIL